MSVPSLQNLALCQINFKEAVQADAPKRGVLTRLFLANIVGNERLFPFNETLEGSRGHICVIQNFDVWHGSSIGPRKFRKKTLCRCKCQRLGPQCVCDCGALIRMVKEFREAEPFHGYRPNQKKHKRCPRFISKKTTLGRLLEGRFPYPL